MKKVIRSPTLDWRVGNTANGRSTEDRSSGVRAQPYDLKKAILPRSLDLMFALKYRR
jgi:hypothetical protein